MITVDTASLASIINQCFTNSSDGRFTDAEQASFLLDGKRLRGVLMNLLSAQFDDGTQAVLAANETLSAIDDSLSDSAALLANKADVLNQIATLVGTLDSLLSVATNFV
jgi:hypothetical protein